MHNAVKVPYLIQNQPSNLGKDKLPAGRLQEKGLVITLRRVKSGKVLQFSISPNPNGVEQLIAPGVNPGYGIALCPGTLKGFNY